MSIDYLYEFSDYYTRVIGVRCYNYLYKSEQSEVGCNAYHCRAYYFHLGEVTCFVSFEPFFQLNQFVEASQVKNRLGSYDNSQECNSGIMNISYNKIGQQINLLKS